MSQVRVLYCPFATLFKKTVCVDPIRIRIVDTILGYGGGYDWENGRQMKSPFNSRESNQNTKHTLARRRGCLADHCSTSLIRLGLNHDQSSFSSSKIDRWLTDVHGSAIGKELLSARCPRSRCRKVLGQRKGPAAVTNPRPESPGTWPPGIDTPSPPDTPDSRTTLWPPPSSETR